MSKFTNLTYDFIYFNVIFQNRPTLFDVHGKVVIDPELTLVIMSQKLSKINTPTILINENYIFFKI